jgi:putative membrane protein
MTGRCREFEGNGAMMMKTRAMWVCGVTAVLAVQGAVLARHQGMRHAMRGSADASFMREAAHGGFAEVQTGHLAEQRGASDRVRNFGRRMLTDHGKANVELARLAQSKGVILPTGPNQEQKHAYNRLARLSGRSFDRAYMNDMVSDHVEDVAKFRDEAKNGHDPDVRRWASRTLPTLEMHLAMARQIHNAMNGHHR